MVDKNKWLGIAKPEIPDMEPGYSPTLTVRELINLLKELDPSRKVYVADLDESKNIALTGVNASGPGAGVVLEYGGYGHPDTWQG